MSEIGTPGFGLVPNGVSAVTVTYQVAPPRTVAVDRNFFVIGSVTQTAPPCGVQWLDPTGNVSKIAVGCSFLTVERQRLNEYRGYVAGKLSRAARAGRGARRGDRLGQPRRGAVRLVDRALDLARDRPGRRCLRRVRRARRRDRRPRRRPSARDRRPGLHRLSPDRVRPLDQSATCRRRDRHRHAPAPARTADEGPARRPTSRPPPPASATGCSDRTRCSRTRSATR